MPMYSLIEYSSNYSKTTKILWFYSTDEATTFDALMNLKFPSIRLNYYETQLLILLQMLLMEY